MSFQTIFEGDSNKTTKKINVSVLEVLTIISAPGGEASIIEGVSHLDGKAFSLSDAPPVINTELSNKKYVDDSVNSIEQWSRDGSSATIYPRVPGDKVAGGLTSGGSFEIESTLNATKGSITLTGDEVIISNILTVDLVQEKTGDAGVVIDGVLLKNFEVSTDVINELSSGLGVTADGLLLRDGRAINSTNAAPSSDPELANKLYVDNTVGAATFWSRNSGEPGLFPSTSGDKILGGTGNGVSLSLLSTSNVNKGTINVGLLAVNTDNISNPTGDILLKSLAGGRAGFTTSADVDKIYLDEDTNTINVDDQMTLNLPATASLLLDGDTISRTSNLGVMNINVKPGINAASAQHIVIDNIAEFDDVRGITIKHDVSGVSTNINCNGIVCEFNVNGATNAHLNCIDFTKTGIKDASVVIHGIHCGEDILPIFHESGGLTSIEKAFIFDDSGSSFIDVTIPFNSTSSDTSIFDGDNDILYIGKDAKFSIIDFDLGTGASGTGISPVFEYFNGTIFTVIGVTDNTDGMQNTGTIIFAIPGDWATTAVNGITKFWFRITRTKNVLSTAPVENLVQYSSSVVFTWDESGDLTINDLICNEVTSSSLTVSSLISTDGAKKLISTDLATIAIGGTNISLSGNTINNDNTQALNTGDNVTFLSATHSSLSISSLIQTDGAKKLISTDLATIATGGTNISLVGNTINNDNTQALNTGDNVTFLSATHSSLTASSLIQTDGAKKLISTDLATIATGGTNISLVGNTINNDNTQALNTGDTVTFSQVNTDLIQEKTGTAGVTIDGVLLKDFEVSTDVINELSAGVGVTIDGVVLKDTQVGIGISPSEQLHLTGNIRMVPTTATTGIILSGADRFIHNFGGFNLFSGVEAGNLTLSSASENIGLGFRALQKLTTGSLNCAVGVQSQRENTTGSCNTAIGRLTSVFNQSGIHNTAIGDISLKDNLASQNTAIGALCMDLNTSGSANTAIGFDSFDLNTTGSRNISIGAQAGSLLTTGDDNIDIGHVGVAGESVTIRLGTTGTQTKNFQAGIKDVSVGVDDAKIMIIDSNGQIGTTATSGATFNGDLVLDSNFEMPVTTASVGVIKRGAVTFIHSFGTRNLFVGPEAGNLTLTAADTTGIGHRAIFAITSASRCVSVGSFALASHTTGNDCVAIGYQALNVSTTATNNTAVGKGALRLTNATSNVALGFQAGDFNVTGQSNTYLGVNADCNGTAFSNSCALGSDAIVDQSNMIRLGDGNISLLECNSALTETSDVNVKNNFLDVDGEETLIKLSQINVGSWNFIQDQTRRHYGPMAQDMYAKFGECDHFGKCASTTTINSGDLRGILMIGVKALEKRTKDQKALIDSLLLRVSALETLHIV